MTAKNRKKKTIMVVCPYPRGVSPAQRLKYEQYFDYLEQNGYSIRIFPFVSDRLWSILYQKGHFSEKFLWTIAGYLKRLLALPLIPFYDGLFIHKFVVPMGFGGFEILYSKLNKRMVYDIDDMIFLSHSSQANSFTRWFKSPFRVTRLIRKAKHVITCTPTLDKFVRQFNPNTTDISSTIDTLTYQPSGRYVNEPGKPIILGWSGSHSTEPYLSALANVLQRVASQRQIRLLVIGSGNFQMPGIDVESLVWKRETEVRDLQRIDIGLYPLPDTPWIYGKSGLKALQYMALGIPAVATSIGTNFRVIEDGVSGRLVNSEDQWVEALIDLIDHPEKRCLLGTAGRERVQKYYSIEANRDTYLAIFDHVYGTPEGWPRPEGFNLKSMHPVTPT